MPKKIALIFVLILAALGLAFWSLKKPPKKEISEPHPPLIIPVLCYHKFADESLDDYTVALENFEEQLVYLKENNFRSISLKALMQIFIQKNKPVLNFRPIIITVDDGHRSFLTGAFPLLKKYGFSAVLFVPANFPDKNKKFLSWAELKFLIQEGFEIGSHTLTHPHFVKMADKISYDDYQKIAARELAEPIKIFQQKLNYRVTALAFPYGIYDWQLKKMAQSAGYQMLFSINPEPNSENSQLDSLARFNVDSSQTLANFIKRVESLPLKFFNEEPRDGALIKDLPATISAQIEPAQINPQTLKMIINSTKVPFTFDAEKKIITALPQKNTLKKARVFLVIIQAKSKDGEKNYFSSWLFRKKPRTWPEEE